MYYKVGDLCKHFKGESLIEKNIYEILAVNVKYTGDAEITDTLIVYKALFQENKYFTREYKDLVKELSDEERLKFHQDIRVQKLDDDEIKLISTEEFRIKKEKYIKNKY